MNKITVDLAEFRLFKDVEVRFRDLDAFGHVNNAVFVTYLEVARAHYWQKVCQAHLATDFDFIIARVEVDYLKPIPMFTNARVYVRVGEMHSSSFFFHYAIVSPDGKELFATARTVQVMFDYAKQKKKALSDELRARLDHFESTGKSA